MRCVLWSGGAWCGVVLLGVFCWVCFGAVVEGVVLCCWCGGVWCVLGSGLWSVLGSVLWWGGGVAVVLLWCVVVGCVLLCGGGVSLWRGEGGLWS